MSRLPGTNLIVPEEYIIRYQELLIARQFISHQTGIFQWNDSVNIYKKDVVNLFPSHKSKVMKILNELFKYT